MTTKPSDTPICDRELVGVETEDGKVVEMLPIEIAKRMERERGELIAFVQRVEGEAHAYWKKRARVLLARLKAE